MRYLNYADQGNKFKNKKLNQAYGFYYYFE